jgi:hypothetical protein
MERRGIGHTLRAEGGGMSTPRPCQSTPGKETQYPTSQEAARVIVSVWTGTKNLTRSRVRTPIGTPVLLFIASITIALIQNISISLDVQLGCFSRVKMLVIVRVTAYRDVNV